MRVFLVVLAACLVPRFAASQVGDEYRGRLVDEDEFPVVGARVSSCGSQTESDENGEFALPQSDCELVIEAEGFEPSNVPRGEDAVMLYAADEVYEAVVTVGRRYESSEEAMGRTEVVAREEIATSGARNAAEVLEERAGLQIQRTFRGAAIFLRGLDPEYTLVLVDGDRLPGATGGAIDLSRYGVENIERIEVVRGPSSALYGSEAIGGVVNILTREDSQPFSASASLSAGANEGGAILDGTGYLSGRLGGFRLHASGGYHRTEPFGEDENGATAGSGRTQWSLDGSARYQDEHHRLRLSGQYVRTDLVGVDASGGGRAIFDRRQLQEQALFALTHRLERGPFSVRSRASLGTYREQYRVDQRNAQELDQFEDNQEWITQLSTVLSAEVHPRHIVTFGLEQLMQRLDSERLRERADRYRFAAFAEHRWTIWRDGDRSVRLASGARLDLDSQFGNQPSPKLALRVDPHEDWTIQASYGRGFRASSFQEQLLRFENPTVGYVVNGNADLDAERSHSVDVSVDWLPVPFFGVGLALYRNDLSQMIGVITESTGSSGTVFTYGNIARAWTMGGELTTRLNLHRYLDLRFGYALTVGRDVDQGRALEGRATHRFTARALTTIPVVELNVLARLAVQADRVFFEGDERVDVSPLSQLDLRIGRSFVDRFEVFAGIDNVAQAGDRFAALLPRTFYAGARGSY